MILREDKGCSTPQDTVRKEVYQHLVQLFAPLIYFEPEERFFPVDLSSSIQHSSLWRTDSKIQPPTSQREKDVGAIIPTQDLLAATSNHYITVAGHSLFKKHLQGKPPFDMPRPLLEAVYDSYKNGIIPAELTIYGTVCSAREVPNSELIQQARGQDVRHAISEGLIINYYMYFPACESLDFQSEGDWSGISLLLRETPTQLQQLNDPQQLQRFLPVIACYYCKMIDGSPPAPYFVAANQGFRLWEKVKRGREQSLGLDTHPIVYVSRGRHNCYFEPITTSIKLSPPWESTFTADHIEGGYYTAGGPTEPVLKGGGIEEFPWWGYIPFPPFAALVACATGCEYPAHFDSSGLPVGYQKGEDQAKNGGYDGLSGASGSSYPKAKAGQVSVPSRKVGLRLRYVDLDDLETRSLWSFPGAWGAATLMATKLESNPDNQWLWGYYQGARRPVLAAWFLWNLFLDSTFGCGGKPELARKPW